MPTVDNYQLMLLGRSGPQPHDWTVEDRIGPEDAVDFLAKRLRKEKRLTHGLALCAAPDAEYQLFQLGSGQRWWVKRS